MKQDIEKLFSSFIDIGGDVPFGNSDWQNRHAIVNEELTPYRAYRQSALRIINRFNALREAYYGLKEKEIEAQEQRDKLSRPWWKPGAIRSKYERHRTVLKLERAEGDIPWTKKLIADALNEITCLLPVITAIGPLSRDEFEGQEHVHFEKKLKRELPKPDADLYALLMDTAKMLPNKNDTYEMEFMDALHHCAVQMIESDKSN